MPVEVVDMTESDGVVNSSEDDTRCDNNNTCSYQPSDHLTDYVNTGYQQHSTAGNITDSEDYLKPTNSVAKK